LIRELHSFDCLPTGPRQRKEEPDRDGKNTDEKIKYVDAELDKYYDNFMYIKSQPLMIIKMLLVTAL